jgi:hypothetical protein
MLNPYYLGSFETNYIIFQIKKNSKKPISKEIFFKGKYQIFNNNLFVEMKISKLIIIQQTCIEGEHIWEDLRPMLCGSLIFPGNL